MAHVHQDAPARPCARRFPTTSTPTCGRLLRARGDRLALLPPGRRVGDRDAPRPHDRDDRHRQRQVTVLQPSRCCTCWRAIRGRARSTCIRPRRSPRTRPAASPSCALRRCATRSTTGTRRRRSARRSASARTSCSPTRTCCTSGSCPTTPAGATSSPTSRSWSWTRRTCTAACSARTSRTCCAACGGSPRPTGPSPRFVLTSATIANPLSLAQELTGLEFDLVDRDGSERGRREVVMCNPPLLDERTGRRASSLGEAANVFADLVAAEVRTICFARSRRAAELIYQFARKRLEDTLRPRGPRDSLPRRLHAAASAARSSAASPRATCSAWSPPTRSSSASTSATSTPRCRSRSPAPSRACASSGGAPGAPSSGGLAMYVAGDDALDQFFCRHPEEFLDRPVEAAILDHCSEQIYMSHLLRGRLRGAARGRRRGDAGAGNEPHAERLVAAGGLRKRGRRYTRASWQFPAAQALAALGIAGQLHDRRGRGAAS